MDKSIPVVIIMGPTATGKSRLAVEVALTLDAEIVSADSMQVYTGLDIATAKISKEEMCGIKHHMIDIVSPDEIFTTSDYVKAARSILEDIHRRKKFPLVTGGTGLYISSLLEKTDYDSHPYNLELRKEIEKEYDIDGGTKLMEELTKSDSEYALRLHQNDKKRVVRAIEMKRHSSLIPSQINLSIKEDSTYDFFPVVIEVTDRQKLYSLIDNRIDRMVEQGLVAEAEYVFRNKDRFITAAQAIGYKELFDYFEGKKDLPDCIDSLKHSSRRYAKRQITYFHRIKDAYILKQDEVDAKLLVKAIQKRYNF